MKICITENIDKAIENYTLVPILYGKVDMHSLPNNCATEIVAIDAVDSIPSDLLPTFVSSVKNKMRLGAKLHIGGFELSALSRAVMNGNISTKEYNDLIFSKKGIYKSKDILSLLQQVDLQIEKVLIRGYFYEITATRPINSN